MQTRWQYRPSSSTGTTSSCPYLLYIHIVYTLIIYTSTMVYYILTRWHTDTFNWWHTDKMRILTHQSHRNVDDTDPAAARAPQPLARIDYIYALYVYMLYIQIYMYYTDRHNDDIDASITQKHWRYRPSSGTSTAAAGPYLLLIHKIYIYVIYTYIIVSYIQTHSWHRRINHTETLTIQTQQRHEHHDRLPVSIIYTRYMYICYIYKFTSIIHTDTFMT